MQDTAGGIADQIALAYAEGKPTLTYINQLREFCSNKPPTFVEKMIVKGLFRRIERRVDTCDRAQLERLVGALDRYLTGNRAAVKAARIIARHIVRAYHNGQESKANRLRTLAAEILDNASVEAAFKAAGVEHAAVVGKSHASKHSTLQLVYAN